MPKQHLATTRFTHPSVRLFAGNADPVLTMIERARSFVLDAQEQGWSGPPFDPVELAAIRRIPVTPQQDITDARTVPIGNDRVRIEFNPDRPNSRTRYSIAHEIAHTLFPDCADRVQHRLSSSEMTDDDWQLEMLCNIGAAEILMPIGSFEEFRAHDRLSILGLLEARRRFAASTEAVLLRAIRLSNEPCMMFAASAFGERDDTNYRIDYAVGSRAWTYSVPRGIVLPPTTVLSECTAIGYTAERDKEQWPPYDEPIRIECVGIPPYPGHDYPRVVGLAFPRAPSDDETKVIRVVRGNALEPRGGGQRIITHLVNDKTPNWGGRFATELRNQWPEAQTEFRRWAEADPTNLRLGQVHLCAVEDAIHVCTVVAQHGYGSSPKPRIRYHALETCLHKLAPLADDLDATVHMPRIGCGEARGLWGVVSEIVDEALCVFGIDVTVYVLPGEMPSLEQRTLF